MENELIKALISFTRGGYQLARIYVNESNSYSRRWLRLENGARKNVNLTLNNIFRLLLCSPLCVSSMGWSKKLGLQFLLLIYNFVVMIYLFNKELKGNGSQDILTIVKHHEIQY